MLIAVGTNVPLDLADGVDDVTTRFLSFGRRIKGALFSGDKLPLYCFRLEQLHLATG
jgi:hypothetical protein